MFKMILLLRKRPDLSTAQFRDYYERHHAPLGISCLPTARRYVRRYFDRAADTPITEGETVFDVMTELWFDDKAAYDAAMARIASSGDEKRLHRDEANLFDASRTCFFVTEEAETSI